MSGQPNLMSLITAQLDYCYSCLTAMQTMQEVDKRCSGLVYEHTVRVAAVLRLYYKVEATKAGVILLCIHLLFFSNLAPDRT